MSNKFISYKDEHLVNKTLKFEEKSENSSFGI